MYKIGKTILSIILLIFICSSVTFIVPELKESMMFWGMTIFDIFKRFFWRDVIKEWSVYLVIFIFVSIIFGYISKKTEEKLWNVVSVLCLLVEIVIFIIKRH